MTNKSSPTGFACPLDPSSLAGIVQRLEAADDAYYNSGEPLLSDAAYDALLTSLRQQDPQHPHLTRVGTQVRPGWRKVRHGQPMASLNKAQMQPDYPDPFVEFRSWLSGCGYRPGDKLVCSTKLDGLSLSLEYRTGRLVQALTRGDGEEGQDVTRNARRVQNVIDLLPEGFCGFIRGEVLLDKKTFKAAFSDMSTARNAASGTLLRQQDAERCAHLHFRAFSCVPTPPTTLRFLEKQGALHWLQHWGFAVPAWVTCSTVESALEVYQRYADGGRADLPYEIDGLVFEFASTARMEELGDMGRGPKGAVALKFPAESQETTLKAIDWQVGKSGRITPVAKFNTVNLGGRSITRASMAGVEQVEHLRLFAGCKILVSARNDVIPRVEANLDEGIENL